MTADTDYDSWAWLYDRTLGPAYRDRKMAFLHRTLLDRIPPRSRVLDLCCGTGQMMAPMIARGHVVTGLDLSADMLRHAAINAPGAELVQGDARDFRLEGRFAGAVCASASLNHMATGEDLARVFRSMHDALDDGGIFVFDINHPAQMERHWKGRPTAGEITADYAWFITPRYDPATANGAFRVDMYRRPDAARIAGSRLTLKLLSRPILRRWRMARLARFRADHPDWHHRAVDYPVHGHPLEEVARLLSEAGFDFRLETFSGKGEVDGDNAACFVCVKRASLAEAAE